MFRRSCNIDISKTDLKGVQRKLHYTYCQNKLVCVQRNLQYTYRQNKFVGYSQVVTLLHILKTNLWGVQKRSQYTYLIYV